MTVIRLGDMFANYIPFEGEKLHFSTLKVVGFSHDKLGIFAECEETYWNGKKNTGNPHWSIALIGEELRTGWLKRINP